MRVVVRVEISAILMGVIWFSSALSSPPTDDEMKAALEHASHALGKYPQMQLQVTKFVAEVDLHSGLTGGKKVPAKLLKQYIKMCSALKDFYGDVLWDPVNGLASFTGSKITIEDARDLRKQLVDISHLLDKNEVDKKIVLLAKSQLSLVNARGEYLKKGSKLSPATLTSKYKALKRLLDEAFAPVKWIYGKKAGQDPIFNRDPLFDPNAIQTKSKWLSKEKIIGKWPPKTKGDYWGIAWRTSGVVGVLSVVGKWVTGLFSDKTTTMEPPSSMGPEPGPHPQPGSTSSIFNSEFREKLKQPDQKPPLEMWIGLVVILLVLALVGGVCWYIYQYFYVTTKKPKKSAGHGNNKKDEEKSEKPKSKTSSSKKKKTGSNKTPPVTGPTNDSTT